MYDARSSASCRGGRCNRLLCLAVVRADNSLRWSAHTSGRSGNNARTCASSERSQSSGQKCPCAAPGRPPRDWPRELSSSLARVQTHAPKWTFVIARLVSETLLHFLKGALDLHHKATPHEQRADAQEGRVCSLGVRESWSLQLGGRQTTSGMNLPAGCAGRFGIRFCGGRAGQPSGRQVGAAVPL